MRIFSFSCRVVLTLIAASLMAPDTSSAATSPIEAHAGYVEDGVNYISIEDSQTYTVEIDTPFQEGDRITTALDGRVEIEFDTGELIFLDNDTDMVIRSLSRDDQGAVSAVFDLLIGRIKSTFSSLSASDSIEYHTRAAITGIAGTPEHIIDSEKMDTGKTRTNVYLNTNVDGSLTVQGFDPDKTIVTLFGGMGTTVIEGMPPMAPFIVPPSKLKLFEELSFQPARLLPPVHTGPSLSPDTKFGSARKHIPPLYGEPSAPPTTAGAEASPITVGGQPIEGSGIPTEPAKTSTAPATTVSRLSGNPLPWILGGAVVVGGLAVAVSEAASLAESTALQQPTFSPDGGGNGCAAIRRLCPASEVICECPCPGGTFEVRGCRRGLHACQCF